jgi:type IV pilus assembly protein PilA
MAIAISPQIKYVALAISSKETLMFCYRCGSSMPDNATACPQCGAAVQGATQPVVPTPAAATPTPSAPQPAGYQPSVPQGQPPYYGQPQESEGKATASLILGILSVTCFGLLAGIPAVILGHIAKSNIRKSGGRLSGDSKATAGLIMGYLSIALVPIIFALAIPSLLRSKIAANEAAAAATVRTIITSQITYSTSYPTAGYARDLATLGPGSTGTCSSGGTQDHACLLDSRLANSSCTAGSWCVKDGYDYSLAASNCGPQVCSDFVVVAKPLSAGSTGNKSFCSTSDAVVRWRSVTVGSMPTVEECQSWDPV